MKRLALCFRNRTIDLCGRARKGRLQKSPLHEAQTSKSAPLLDQLIQKMRAAAEVYSEDAEYFIDELAEKKLQERPREKRSAL